MRKSYTFRVLVIFILLVLLQWFPITGVFLMMFGAAVWTGYIPHILAGAFVLDVWKRDAPIVLLLIPVLPYLVYCGLYFAEQKEMRDLEREIREQNPSIITTYNPEEHAIVSEHSLVQTYKIPVSYTENGNVPEGYMSHRLVTKNLCDDARKTEDSIRASIVSKYLRGARNKKFSNLCYFRMAEKPNKTLLKIKETRTANKKVRKTALQFFMGDERIGEFVRAEYAAAPVFPKFIIGCALISSTPRWECTAQLRREKVQLKTYSVTDEQGNNTDYISALLGIDVYEDEDLNSFIDYQETKDVLGELIERKKNETPADFDKWGLRKDSAYQPVIGEKRGYLSFKGMVYSRNKGGPFREFIKQNEGKVVYLDIIAKVNANKRGFGNYGVCEIGKECNGRTDNYYRFEKKGGGVHRFEKKGVFKGFFLIGPEAPSKCKRNKDDNDTVTILTVIPEEELGVE